MEEDYEFEGVNDDSMEPSSSINLPQALLSVDLANLCMNGAKTFDDENDKNRFIEEFTELARNNSHWTPVRLIRERLKLQMNIKNDRIMTTRQDREQNIPSSSNTKKRSAKNESSDSENEEREDFAPGLSNSDRLLENINKQIDNERSIELDEAKTIYARPDNFIVIDAGDGNCVVLDCYELMAQNRQNMQRVENIHLYNSNDFSRNTSNNHQNSNTSFGTRSGRVKHACPNCSRTFVNLDRYVEHLKQDHGEFDESFMEDPINSSLFENPIRYSPENEFIDLDRIKTEDLNVSQ